MPRKRTPHIAAEKRKPATVHIRSMLDGLSPSMRALALEMSGGDATRVKVLRPGAFEILDPETSPTGHLLRRATEPQEAARPVHH